MKIQQHDGVVVDAAGARQGFAKRKGKGEVLRRGREAQRARCGCPPSLPLYIGARVAHAPLEIPSKRGGGPWGQRPP